MKDAAYKAFTEFAARHSLKWDLVDTDMVELLVRLPIQELLSFEIQLAYSDDVINLVAGEHTGEWYIVENDFEAAWQKVQNVMDGLVTGSCRIVELRQRGRLWKTAIEICSQNQWSAVSIRFHNFLGLHWPFFGSETNYIKNTFAR